MRPSLLLVLLIACGSPPAPDSPPAPKLGAPQPAPASSAPTVVHYARIDRVFVEKHSPVKFTDAQCIEGMSERTQSQGAMSDTRHILFKVPKEAPPDVDAAAKQKAQAALQRVFAGQDFAGLARELSEDPGSKTKGGLYSWDRVAHFVEPYRRAYFLTPPGQPFPEPVRSAFGWHVIWKEPADDAAKLRGCRKGVLNQIHFRLASETNYGAQETRDENAVLKRVLTKVLGEAAAKEAPPFERLDPSGTSKAPPCAALRKQADATQNWPDAVWPGGFEFEGDFFLTKVYATKDAPDVPVGNACRK